MLPLVMKRYPHNARLVTDNEISGLCEVYSTLDSTAEQETGPGASIWAYTCCAIRVRKFKQMCPLQRALLYVY